MPGKERSVQSEYMLSQGYRDSARLHLQHWMCKEVMGYVLHPSIPKSALDWTVADIGTGNACWLVDIARKAPSSWDLQGFDVSSSHFPVAANLPSNVSLGYLDAFDDVPAKFIARFDLIRVRAFAMVVKGGNVNPLLQNLARMLKPGGYLQWDEFDLNTYAARSPATKVPKHSSDQIIGVWRGFMEKLGLKFNWIPTLGKSFSKHRINVLDDESFGPTLFTCKLATENWLMALEEAGSVIIKRGGEAGSQISLRDYLALLGEAEVETRGGVSLWIDIVVVVGRQSFGTK